MTAECKGSAFPFPCGGLQLRIFAAGVLHNAALALISLFCMYLAVPLVLDLVYARGLGAVVVDVHPVREFSYPLNRSVGRAGCLHVHDLCW
jgi:hypothetical protein